MTVENRRVIKDVKNWSSFVALPSLCPFGLDRTPVIWSNNQSTGQYRIPEMAPNTKTLYNVKKEKSLF